MVKFTNSTQMIFFDLEFSVPKTDRSDIGASLNANPFRKDHYLLGGVFCRWFPLKESTPRKFQHFWVWDFNSEEVLLKNILGFFKQSWNVLKNKNSMDADLITVGTGISRFDIPVLFARSIELDIAPKDLIFEYFCKTKVVDLSEVAIPYFNKLTPVMYPIPTKQIAKKFGININKKSGKRVWELLEFKDYDAIEKRTESEVLLNVDIYKKIYKEIYA